MESNSFLGRFSKRGSGHALKLTFGQAVASYRRLYVGLESTFDGAVSYELTNEMPQNVAGATTDSDGHISISVKVPFLNDTRRFRNTISDVDYIGCRVAIEHETQHARQMIRARSDDAETALILVNDEKNPVKYHAVDNYFHNSTEIEAEKAGIVNTRAALESEFPDVSPKELDGIMFDYVKSRTEPIKLPDGTSQRQEYFVHMPDSWTRDNFSIGKLAGLFNKALSDAKQFPSVYSSGVRFDRVQDDFTQTVYVADGKSPWWTAYDKLKSSWSEQESHRVMGSITCLNHPEFFEKYPSLQKIQGELQPDVVFGEGFLQRVSEYDRRRNASSPYLQHFASDVVHDSKQFCRKYPSGGPATDGSCESEREMMI